MDAQTDEYEDIDWIKNERIVYKLQRRIYQASNKNRKKDMHRLQKLLVNSYSARCLAVRRVTTENQGKRTPGIDGVSSLNNKQRVDLIHNLKLEGKSLPVRRIYISKQGKNELRPLGIPTIRDRARQALALLALDAEWEAKFEPNSYGFRPARSCWDAIDQVFNIVRLKSKFILDADISKCFDRISHKALIAKLDTWPAMRRTIKGWLKCGIIDKDIFSTSEHGAPQGGVISPLLANIALNGMEQVIKNRFANAHIVIYADDFIIAHPELEGIIECKKIIEEWLSEIGLELNQEKTRIIHTLNEYNGQQPGFDFLGFHIRQYRVGKYQSGKNRWGQILGTKTIIKPSKKAIRRHVIKLKQVIRSHQTAPIEALISKLNPIIRGWCNYYSTVCSRKTFSKLKDIVYHQLRAMLKQRHGRKRGRKRIVELYWLRTGKWRLTTSNGKMKLLQHTDIPIRRHIKVRGSISPYNGDEVYWASRMGRHPNVSTREAKLLKKQQGKCSWCDRYFITGNRWEIDRIIPAVEGGKYKYVNMQLLHINCHFEKTAIEFATRCS